MRPEERSNCTAAVCTVVASWNQPQAILHAKELRFNSLTDWWELLNERHTTLDLGGVDKINATFHRTMGNLKHNYDISYSTVLSTVFALAIAETPTSPYPERTFRNPHDMLAQNHTTEDLATMAAFTYTITVSAAATAQPPYPSAYPWQSSSSTASSPAYTSPTSLSPAAHLQPGTRPSNSWLWRCSQKDQIIWARCQLV